MGLVLAGLICGSGVSAQVAVSDLYGEIVAGRVRLLTATGNGASSGAAVEGYLMNETATERHVGAHLTRPIYLANSGAGQDMVATAVYLGDGGYLSDGRHSFITLRPGVRTAVLFIAYCVDFDKDNPSSSDQMVVGSVPSSLVEVMRNIGAHVSANPRADITVAAQVAIWLAQGVDAAVILPKFGFTPADERLARILVGNGEIDVRDERGTTALFRASRNGNEVSVRSLLEEGADVNLADNSGWTPLMIASQEGHAGIVHALLNEGAEVNLRGDDGVTALIQASFEGHDGIVRALLNEGAEIDVQEERGATALYLASQNQHMGIVQALLDQGANVDLPDNELGWTALTQAANRGHERVLQALLVNGADINHQLTNGSTPLIQASLSGHEGVVEALLARGAEIDHQTSLGVTALIVASYRGHRTIVQALLSRGANVHLRQADGGTALEEARTEEIKRLLREAGATE